MFILTFEVLIGFKCFFFKCTFESDGGTVEEECKDPVCFAHIKLLRLSPFVCCSRCDEIPHFRRGLLASRGRCLVRTVEGFVCVTSKNTHSKVVSSARIVTSAQLMVFARAGASGRPN